MFNIWPNARRKFKTMSNIGQRVRALREKLGVTQAELAQRINFVRNYISLVENGRQEPSRKFVQAIDLIEKAPTPYFEQTAVAREEPLAATPRGLIKARRKQLGLSLDDLAKKAGCQKSTLRNVEEGHTRATEKLLRELAKHLDVPLDELTRGSDYPHSKGMGYTDGAEPNVTTGPGVTARMLPLLSWAQAGTTEAWDDIYEHEGIVGYNVRDPKAVAIQIRGDSMEPVFPAGTIAIVYPTWEAKSGDLVIARLNDGTVMFKRLHVDGDKYTFISLNTIYPPRTVDRSEVEKLLPVGGTFQSQL
jgi:transcriptional regulator with XRE-family HTH domain